MNEKFFNLPREKQERIINAALEIFALNPYKRAVTDDIAARAGISKGLLFHYFGSKQQLYAYLYRHSLDFMQEKMRALSPLDERDFFALLWHAQKVKVSVMETYPFLYAFLMRAREEGDAAIAGDILLKNNEILDQSARLILRQIDWSRFREGVDPHQVLNLVLWSAEGFYHLRMQKPPLDLKALSREYLSSVDMLRPYLYKEEYL